MTLHGADLDTQLLGYLGVGAALRNQLQNPLHLRGEAYLPPPIPSWGGRCVLLSIGTTVR